MRYRSYLKTEGDDIEIDGKVFLSVIKNQTAKKIYKET